MASERGNRRKDEEDLRTSMSTDDDDDDDLPIATSSTVVSHTEAPLDILTPTIPGVPAEATLFGSYWKTSRYPGYPTRRPEFPPPFASFHEGASAIGSPYSTSRATPLADDWPSTLSSSPTFIVSYKEPSPSTTATDNAGIRGPGWTWQNKHNNAPMYAVASVIPVVLLAIIGAIVLVCLRKRKRRRQEAVATQEAVHEINKQPQSMVHSYLAPPPASVPRPYAAQPTLLPPTSTPSQHQPIILGPIPSGSNGAYLTGMDTSDVVSITSNHVRPADPFADNSSLAEPPPPPYRPHSVAPPSFASTSRQSSVRSSAPRPTTSRTHLIGSSPFEDAQEEDTMSELSGHTLTRTRSEEGSSTVSDLSYQHVRFVDPCRHNG